MVNDKIRGVALIVYDPDDNILILQEYESKPHIGKYSGMFSVPMETSEPDELDFHAIVRLVVEELQGFDILITDTLLLRIGSYQIVPDVWVNLYSIETVNNHLPDFNPKNKEVGNYRWMRPEEALLLWLRQGAREMISDFLNNKKGVLCESCRAP